MSLGGRTGRTWVILALVLGRAADAGYSASRRFSRSQQRGSCLMRSILETKARALNVFARQRFSVRIFQIFCPGWNEGFPMPSTGVRRYEALVHTEHVRQNVSWCDATNGNNCSQWEFIPRRTEAAAEANHENLPFFASRHASRILCGQGVKKSLDVSAVCCSAAGKRGSYKWSWCLQKGDAHFCLCPDVLHKNLQTVSRICLSPHQKSIATRFHGKLKTQHLQGCQLES